VFITDLSYEHSTFFFSWSAVRLGGVFLFKQSLLPDGAPIWASLAGTRRQRPGGFRLCGFPAEEEHPRSPLRSGRYNPQNHKTVVDHDALGSVLALALALRLVDVDVVDQLLEQRRGEGAHLHESADRQQEAVPALLH